jgi:hypothetical protein
MPNPDKIVRVPDQILRFLNLQMFALGRERDRIKEIIAVNEQHLNPLQSDWLSSYHRDLESVDKDIAIITGFLEANRKAPAIENLTVAYGWSWEGMKGLALGHLPPTADSYKFHERNTKVYPLMVIPGHDEPPPKKNPTAGTTLQFEWIANILGGKGVRFHHPEPDLEVGVFPSNLEVGLSGSQHKGDAFLKFHFDQKSGALTGIQTASYGDRTLR